jgi:hypothetical protein
MADEEIHLDIDPMLFYAMVIEDEMDLIGVFDGAMGMLGMPADVTAGVSGIAREKIEQAQAELDALIEADKTWRPA